MNMDSIFSYFPDKFADKSVSEPFIAFLMSKYLAVSLDKWQQGNPNKFEPDYVVNNQFFEFTIASDRKKVNLIQKLQRVTYSSTNIIKDSWNCIQESLEAKMKKNYSVDNVSVCILCLLDFNECFMQSDGSMSIQLFRANHRGIYDEIKSEVIDKGIFYNVYVIFPFSNETWWIMDIVKDDVNPIALTDKEIKTGNYPFYSKNQVYFDFFKE